jgi:hypothetical protein
VSDGCFSTVYSSPTSSAWSTSAGNVDVLPYTYFATPNCCLYCVDLSGELGTSCGCVLG